MEDRYEIRFAGSGGQGIIMAALVLAEAAAVYDGKYVCQTQSYGPEARGGNSRAEVVISKKVIDYPRATKLDTYFQDLTPDGLLEVDSTLVDQVPTSRVVPIPFTKIAIREAGRELVANMVALGAAGYLAQVVSLKSLEAALIARVPKGTEEMNRKALHAGIKAARKVDLNALPHSVTLEEEDV